MIITVEKYQDGYFYYAGSKKDMLGAGLAETKKDAIKRALYLSLNYLLKQEVLMTLGGREK